MPGILIAARAASLALAAPAAAAEPKLTVAKPKLSRASSVSRL